MSNLPVDDAERGVEFGFRDGCLSHLSVCVVPGEGQAAQLLSWNESYNAEGTRLVRHLRGHRPEAAASLPPHTAVPSRSLFCVRSPMMNNCKLIRKCSYYMIILLFTIRLHFNTRRHSDQLFRIWFILRLLLGYPLGFLSLLPFLFFFGFEHFPNINSARYWFFWFILPK